MAKKSRHALNGKIVKISVGVAIYKTHASQFWYARILDSISRKYVVRSTKETTRIEARSSALELVAERYGKPKSVPHEFTFKYYATRFVELGRRQADSGERNPNYIRTSRLFLDNDQWGLMKAFSNSDVRQLLTRHYQEFMDALARKRPDLSSSTRNAISATFRNVLKVARNDGVIDAVPDTPRTKLRDNPRPFFRFFPLVAKEHDDYQKLLAAARVMVDEPPTRYGTEVGAELYDVIEFVIHTFVRPMTTELYAIKHNDVVVAENPRRLLVTIRNGKTGNRVLNSLSDAVTIYDRIRKRHPGAKGEDFLFLPKHRNRTTASTIIQHGFNRALKLAGIKRDIVSNSRHTVYSLRHTAICMRIILSEGKVNIFNLAKNAGTSVEQIERFYAKNLPLSAEMARNLQSIGDI